MILKRLASSLTICLLVLSSVVAQSPTTQDTEKTEQQKEAEKELERKAYSLLEEVIMEAQTLRLPENRVRVQARAAGLLWPRDQERARAIFRDVMNGIVEMINSDDDTDPRRRGSYQYATQLRQEIMQVISRHDAEFALEFLRATRQQPSSRNNGRFRGPDNEDRLEMNLAGQIAANDPKRALQLAQENLKKDVSYEIINPLLQLRAKDIKLAQQLANDIVRKLRSENLATNQGALGVAVNLVTLERNSNRNQSNAANQPAVLDEQTLKELVGMITNAALSPAAANSSNQRGRGGPQNIIRSVQTILPEIEKYEPARVAAVRNKTSQMNGRGDERSRTMNEFQNLVRSNAPIDTLLEAAANAPYDYQDTLYQQAAWKVLNEGDTDLARQIVNENISDPNRRNQMLATINSQLVAKAADQEKLEEARALISQVQPKERRIAMLVQLALTTEKTLGKKPALQILDDARYMVNSRAENYQHIEARLQVARAYVDMEPARGFELLEMTIDHLNELVAAAEILNGFDIREMFDDGEMRLQPRGQLINMTDRCINEIASLSKADFERAKILSDRFQRLETRVMAHLAVTEGAIMGQAGGSSFNRRNFVIRNITN